MQRLAEPPPGDAGWRLVSARPGDRSADSPRRGVAVLRTICGAGALIGLALALASIPVSAATEPAAVASPNGKPAKPDAGFFGQLSPGSRKEPIVVQSNQLEFDYEKNRLIYRGKVHVTQGDLIIDSATLTVTFGSADDQKQAGSQKGGQKQAGSEKPVQDRKQVDPKPGSGPQQANGANQTKLDEVIAEGDVVITQGTRWATGGKAVFDQSSNTIVLSENPVLHDGPNEVNGERLVVYLNEGRSIVESSPKKRVSAILYPGSESPTSTAGAATGEAAKTADAKRSDAPAATASPLPEATSSRGEP